MIPSLQDFPIQPDGQLHLLGATHCPPFWHAGAQTAVNETHSSVKIDIKINGYIWENLND